MNSSNIRNQIRSRLPDSPQALPPRAPPLMITSALSSRLRAAEQALVPGSTLRVIEDVHGHASLFGLGADYAEQVDAALSDLLGAQV